MGVMLQFPQKCQIQYIQENEIFQSSSANNTRLKSMYFDFPISRESNKKADALRDSLLLSCPNFPVLIISFTTLAVLMAWSSDEYNFT